MSDVAADSNADTNVSAPTGAPSPSSNVSNVQANASFRRPGMGKGGKGLGKGGAKRHMTNKNKYDLNPLEGVTRGAIRRICQRSGIKRMSGIVYDEIRKTIEDYTHDVMCYALCYTKHRRKETLINTDIVHATFSSKVVDNLFGFDDANATARGKLTGKKINVT
jgi:histone H4